MHAGIMATPVWSSIFYKVMTGFIITAGVWIMAFPIRAIVKSVKTAWSNNTQILEKVHQELELQRTNCLQTIQSDGKKQVELLGKAVETLGDIQLGQAEMSGYLKGLKGKL